MRFVAIGLLGVTRIEVEPREDERGFVARIWCQREFAEHGLEVHWVQCNVPFNKARGTLRGRHYQVAPHAEAELVRCTQGAIRDVVVDLRPECPTVRQYTSAVLTVQNYHQLYIPAGLAHSFLTLADYSEVVYQMSAFYASEAARGVGWDDAAFAVEWPAQVGVIEARDQGYPDFAPTAAGV
jgi:dTDP-4-dehydrorhamnose 3,5-epimerase